MAPAILSDVRKPRKRGNGEGTVVPRKGPPPRWDAVIVVGWTLEGRPVRRSRSASSEAQARKLLADMRRARDGGDPLPDDRLTTATFLRDWLARTEPHVRPTTYRTYRFAIATFLLPNLGAVPLRRLRARHVTAMLDSLADLSPYTVAGARSVLRRALADAERDRLVDHNAAALAHGPVLPGRISAPAAADVRAVLAAVRDHRLSPLFVLDALTGLRLGEVTGLRWVDVDAELLRIRVQLQATRDPDEPFVLTEPKTPAARRVLRLGPAALEALRTQRIRQGEERMAAGRRWQNASDLVFTTSTGGPLSPNTVRWVLSKAQDDASVARFPFHSLRRFAGTVVGDLDMKAAQALLGHRAETLTADVYASTTRAAMDRASAAMEEAIGG